MTGMDPNTRAELKREIVGVYDRASSIYNRVGIRQFTYYADLLIAMLNIPPGAQVLDVATGRGALLFPAADGFDSTSRQACTVGSVVYY